MPMNQRIGRIWRPLWQYLNQPLGHSQSVWKPSRFWYLYKIQLLETCWHKHSAHQRHYTQ